MVNKLDYEKKIIGYLFKYYFKNTDLTINEIIDGNDEYYHSICSTCDNCTIPERICSKATLLRLYKGSIVTNECIYVRLANKLNKDVILDKYDIYEKINRYQKVLYDNLVDFNATNLEKLESLITIEIEKYKNILYIYEILSLYLNIINDKLYSTNSPKIDDIQVYIFLKDYMDDSNKKLILYYLYTGLFRHGNYNINLDLIYQESKTYFNDDLMYDIKLDSIYELSLLEAYKHLINHEFPKYNSLTSYNKYLLYYSLSNIQVNLESYDEAYNSICKCYEILLKSDFSKIIYFSCYLRMGFVSYCQKDYNKTVNWLIKAFSIKNNLSKDLVMLCKSLEKLDDIVQLKKILANINVKQMKAPYGKKVYQYYSLKHKKEKLTKKDIFELEDFIVDILKPYFEIYGQIHKDAFNEDLKEYVKITGNYKKYYEFNS